LGEKFILFYQYFYKGKSIPLPIVWANNLFYFANNLGEIFFLLYQYFHKGKSIPLPIVWANNLFYLAKIFIKEYQLHCQ
jgi:hypothetical protein